MANTTVVKALTGYFNSGDICPKRPVAQWNSELKALTPEEKADLAQQVCEVTGDTLVVKA